jgi:hypothetical protein
MTLKKIFILIFLILAISSVSIGCVYLVRHMYDTLHLRDQIIASISLAIAGAIIIVAILIKSIIQTIQE